MVALIRAGVKVSLANLSFTNLGGTDAEKLLPNLYRIDAETRASSPYFPEGVLTRFLAERGQGLPVYAFDKTGVLPLQLAYRHVVEREQVDALVLVDGGTDILMRGDEAGLGTPEEDMTSLAAASSLELETRLVCCLGFGVDSYHGVCHAHFLENVAALVKDGGFLGSTSLLPGSEEGDFYLQAVRFAEERMPSHLSIVNTSIASAVEGRFGDYQRTERTRSSELFINPLMSMYWLFELDAVARNNLYLDKLRTTHSIWDVQLAIRAYREGLSLREPRSIPH